MREASHGSRHHDGKDHLPVRCPGAPKAEDIDGLKRLPVRFEHGPRGDKKVEEQNREYQGR